MKAQTDDIGTRQVVLDLIIEKGPITASTLASILRLTPAAVHRHLIYLESTGKIENLEPMNAAARGRRRLVRNYVATNAGRATQPGGYSQVATEALGYLRQFGEDDAIEDFTHHHFHEMKRHYVSMVHAAGEDPEAQVTALTDALAQDGYAATVCHTEDGIALQICQGSHPTQDMARSFPKLYEAETESLSRLLDTHVQRLVTLAESDHACTTSVPLPGRIPGLVSQIRVTVRAKTRRKEKDE